MTATPLLESSWLEPALLVAASRRAIELPDAARARMTPWVVAARARFRVARELRDLETQPIALDLLREAAFFALCALELEDAARESASPSSEEAWSRFAARPEHAPGAPEHLALVRSAFSAADPLSLDRFAASEVNQLRLAAEATVAWLLDLAEIRTPAELARARLLRVALAALALVVIVWALVAYWLALTELSPH